MPQWQIHIDYNHLPTGSPMNRINPKKLKSSKWTATKPTQKEKHFLVTRLIEEDDEIVACVLEAVYSKRESTLDWQDLQDERVWLMGWQ
jgi:tryptophan-rich hypothetical protein